MALGVLNNISAVYAENNLNQTQSGLQKTLQQLSSGSRINSGADDAAGLSLADGLQANATALTQSAQNASEGIDFLQVGDGALSQVSNLLNRAVTLATEASNGTLNSSQTSAANAEYQNILSEIDSINSTTEYNGINTFATASSVSVGSASDTISTQGSTNHVLTLKYYDSTDTQQSLTVASSDATNASSAGIELTTNTLSGLASAINSHLGSNIASVQNNQLILSGGATLSGTLTEDNTIATSNGGTSSAVSTVSVGSQNDTFSDTTPTVYGGSVATATAAQVTAGTDSLGNTVTSGDKMLNATTNTGAAETIDLTAALSTSPAELATITSASNGYVVMSGSNIESVGTMSSAVTSASGITDSFGNTGAAGTKLVTLSSGQTIVSGDTEELAVQVGNGTFSSVTLTGTSLDSMVADINTAAGSSVASIQGDKLVLQGATLNGNITESETVSGTSTNAAAVAIFTSDGNISTKYNNQASDVVMADTSALGLSDSSLSTATGAQTALTQINSAISQVAADRGTLGANINTLTAVENVMTTQSTNTQSAQNDVTATDYASASSNLSKYEILMQTGISALAQANSTQQMVTKLLQ